MSSWGMLIASRRNDEGDSRSRSIQRKNQAIGTVGSENRLRWSGNRRLTNGAARSPANEDTGPDNRPATGLVKAEENPACAAVERTTAKG
jgi:hypothetical protein